MRARHVEKCDAFLLLKHLGAPIDLKVPKTLTFARTHATSPSPHSVETRK
jgi:hypothetical protein